MRPPTVQGRPHRTRCRGGCCALIGVVCVRTLILLMLSVLVGFGLARTARAEAPVSTEPAEDLPTSLPTALDDSVEGKLDQAKKRLAENDYPGAAKASTAAVAQAIREARSAPGSAEAQERVNVGIRALLELGHQALEAEEFGVAKHCYRQLYGIRRPNEWEPLLGLAETARLSGQSWDAYKAYGDYLKLTDRPRDHRGELGLGLVCLGLGNFRTARYHLERAARLAPRNSEAAMGLARALHGLNKHKEAVAHAETALRIDSEAPQEERHTEYQYYLALFLRGARLYDRAAAVARELNDSVLAEFKNAPADPERINRLTMALELRQKLLDDVAGTDQGSRDSQTFMDMARVIEDQGALQQLRAYLQALMVLEQAKELQPENVNVLLQQGRLFRLVNDRDRAVEAYQAVLKISPGQDDAKSALREMDAPLAPPEPTAAPTTTSSPATTSAPASSE